MICGIQHLETRPVPFSWVSSHRELSDAISPEDPEAILRNNEVGKWAKIATALPLPPCEPTYKYIYIYGITCNAPPPPTSVTWGGLEGK